MHAYNAPGTYRVGVKYMDNDGQWSQPYPFTITIREVRRVFYVKDHLGNIRQSLNESGTVVSAQDYYPYGETLRGYISVHPYEKYRFTEKERDIETGYDYFGGRLYDGNLGIWGQTDPLKDKYPGWSSYNYSMNDPINKFDPNGNDVIISKALWNYNSNGFNFKDYAMKSDEFKRMVALFGKGGAFEHINVELRLDKNMMKGNPGNARFYINGKELKSLGEQIKLPKSIEENLTLIRLNPDDKSFKNPRTPDHEISHFAYNASKLLQNEAIPEFIKMWIGSSQDAGPLRDLYPNEMTTNEIIQEYLKAYLESGKNADDENDIDELKEIEDRIIIQ